MDEEFEIGSMPWETDEFPDYDFKTLFQHVSSMGFIVCEMDICFFSGIIGQAMLYRLLAIRICISENSN